jgi:hypothetical protein
LPLGLCQHSRLFPRLLAHGDQLLRGGRSQKLQNPSPLVDRIFSRKQRLAIPEHLRKDAAGRPQVDLRGVVGPAEGDFGRPIVPRANVLNVWLVGLQALGAPKVAQLDPVGREVDQEIVRLDVPVADPQRVQVFERFEEPDHDPLNGQSGHRRGDNFGLEQFVQRRGQVFQDKTEKIFPVLICGVKIFKERNDVWVLQPFNNIQFAIYKRNKNNFRGVLL